MSIIASGTNRAATHSTCYSFLLSSRAVVVSRLALLFPDTFRTSVQGSLSRHATLEVAPLRFLPVSRVPLASCSSLCQHSIHISAL